MLLPYACVTSLVFLSIIFSAISLFTYGWASIVPFNPLYPIIPDEEIFIGLVPFDSSTPFGWLVATCVFMYLNFACSLITFLVCIIGIIIFILRGDSSYQKYIYVMLCGCTFLTGLFGAVAFVIFVASYKEDLEDYFYGDVSIGYSPFLDLIGFVIATIATGVSAFFAIALLNPNNEN
ncbi:hypothetical protein GCK72_023718 [Caenorhabditis remanei]|uniref:Uncharacterized protein n=1 Tax=Caenorhabditis remanei TaxID=31234 RepID=E3M2P3_CAERE|nr:hypothetical protein GCK72_023718 [Caenorhabditis remanei]EFO89907.1 hypothetical protein CRE_07280 [Caenorhabditis remanei]KAF1747256.1 hypothetical protein GCK72_023718 [Caenorhabditis remanei]